MHIKKIIKIFIVNIILILIILASLELFLFYKEYFRLLNGVSLQNKSLNKTVEIYSFKDYLNAIRPTYKAMLKTEININQDYFRETAIPAPPSTYKNIHSLKKSVVLLGCSYTFGDALSNEQAFHSILSKYTNRKVYNLGIGGRGPRSILYILRENYPYINKNIFKNDKDIELFIYTYIPDHKRRLWVNLLSNNLPYYKENKDKTHLKLIKTSKFKNTYIYKELSEIIYDHISNKYPNIVFDKLCLYIKEINREIKNKYPHSKFVIFVYEEDQTDNWGKLEKEGIIIIKASNMLDINLKDSDYRLLDGHPNAKAWEVIVPALAKELKL